jgi:hypothetical protein
LSIQTVFLAWSLLLYCSISQHDPGWLKHIKTRDFSVLAVSQHNAIRVSEGHTSEKAKPVVRQGRKATELGILDFRLQIADF